MQGAVGPMQPPKDRPMPTFQESVRDIWKRVFAAVMKDLEVSGPSRITRWASIERRVSV